MPITVDAIQSRIAAVVDQDPDTSNVSTDDYALRLKYVNMAQDEWAELTDWQVLYKEYNMLVSTSTGNASIVLPLDFRKPASYPKIMDGGQAYEFPIVRPQEAGQYLDSERRVEVLGNNLDRYILRVYGVSLSSGASVKVPYYASAGSLATSTSISPIPNADFLVKRAIGLIWEAREDPRFPGMQQQADNILRNMLERETIYPEGSNFDRVKTTEESRHSFRLGRD